MTFLSPMEQAEVTRFGVHDPEVFEDIIEHWDDTPVCFTPDCDHPADYILVTVCCADKRFICTDCLAAAEANWVEESKHDRVVCGVCGRKFPPRVALRDIVRVVSI